MQRSQAVSLFEHYHQYRYGLLRGGAALQIDLGFANEPEEEAQSVGHIWIGWNVS